MRINGVVAAKLKSGCRNRHALVAGCAGCLAIACSAGAQGTLDRPVQPTAQQHAERTSSVRGLVRDTSDRPIPFATIVWGEARQVISASDTGSFEMNDIPSGRTRFTVRRLGYVPVDFELTLRPGVIKPVVVHLFPAPPALTEVAVEGKSEMDDDAFRAARFRETGFFERRAKLPGYFITPEEVERRRPGFISDLMYAIPGVTMTGRPHSATLRYLSSGQHCKLQLYLDGHPVPDGDDLFPGSDIKAVEVYPSLSASAEKFLPSPLKGYCGSIVVWTK